MGPGSCPRRRVTSCNRSHSGSAPGRRRGRAPAHPAGRERGCGGGWLAASRAPALLLRVVSRVSPSRAGHGGWGGGAAWGLRQNQCDSILKQMTRTWADGTLCHSRSGHEWTGSQGCRKSLSSEKLSSWDGTMDQAKTVLSFRCFSQTFPPVSSQPETGPTLSPSERASGGGRGHRPRAQGSGRGGPTVPTGSAARRGAPSGTSQCRVVIVIVSLSLQTLGTNWVRGFPAHSPQSSFPSACFYFSDTSRTSKRAASHPGLSGSGEETTSGHGLGAP